MDQVYSSLSTLESSHHGPGCGCSVSTTESSPWTTPEASCPQPCEVHFQVAFPAPVKPSDDSLPGTHLDPEPEPTR